MKGQVRLLVTCILGRGYYWTHVDPDRTLEPLLFQVIFLFSLPVSPKESTYCFSKDQPHPGRMETPHVSKDDGLSGAR